jgi:dihydroflavonol-4-reductase
LQVLITGATGFIGSHLAEALVQQGTRVRCLVRKTSDLSRLKGLDLEVIYGDCREKESLTQAVKGVDQVFHLAGATRAKDEKDFFAANAQSTENLILACLDHNPGLEKFLYLSSQAAAGPGQNGTPKSETDPCQPLSYYAQSKRKGELLALAYAKQLPLVILRPSAVYGPGDRDFLFIFKLLSRKINLCLAGKNRLLSLCQVQDLIRAILQAAKNNRVSGEIFFVSDGRGYRIEEIANTFSHCLGVKPVRIPVPEWVIMGMVVFSEGLSRLTGTNGLLSRNKAREILQDNWVCDIRKAQTVLGYVPRIDLDLGARLTVDWYRQEKWL